MYLMAMFREFLADSGDTKRPQNTDLIKACQVRVLSSAPTFLLAAALALWPPQSLSLPLFRDIAQSGDVAWLERLCTDRAYAEAEYAQRGRNMSGVKGNRSAAYVRLGALGTEASLAAIARIEAMAHQRSVLPQPATPKAPSYHPAPHMGDWVWTPAAQVRFGDGRDVAAYVLNAYGPPSLFLAVSAGGRWSPPLMVPIGTGYGEPPSIALRELAGGRVRVEFGPAPNTPVPFQPMPDAIEVSLGELQRDTDGDGWTDIMERHLEMNWRDADSDRDGIPDGQDVTPSYRPPTNAEDEDARILRRAIFSMFGLTESPGALFVADNSRRLQLDGLPGPVFYREGNGGVRVTWKILEKTADTATVKLTDFEGALSASSNEVTLRKINGDWYVVAIRMTSIS